MITEREAAKSEDRLSTACRAMGLLSPRAVAREYHVPAEHPWRKPLNWTFLPRENADISTLR
jgi:hypothetical protein